MTHVPVQVRTPRREIRATDPGAIRRAADARTSAPLVPADGRLMIIACDHPARGANGVGDRPLAMANRIDLLDRLQTALSRPGVDGLLGSPDIIEDLLLLGALEGKVVFGSMNRGGLQGAAFELDDRFTGYDAQGIADMGLNGGKTLTRIALDDPGTLNTLTGTATGDQRARRARAGRDGRTVLVVPGRRQGPQRPVPGRGDQVHRGVQRAGPHHRPHLAEAARRARDGPGDGRHHPPDPAARRRPGHQPRGDLRLLAGGAAAARRCAAWSSAAPCSTRPMTTSRPPSTPPPPWSADRVAVRRSLADGSREVTAIHRVNSSSAGGINPRATEPHKGAEVMTTITDPEAVPAVEEHLPATAVVLPHWKDGAPFAGRVRPHRTGLRPGHRAGDQAGRAGLRGPTRTP